jgi:hypothetical protein
MGIITKRVRESGSSRKIWGYLGIIDVLWEKED